MVQFVLIRPGSTDYDQQGRIQGTLDIPLNEQGRSQVGRIVDELRNRGITSIFCGPNQSSCDTAETLGEALKVKVKKLDALANLNHGLWQGMLIDDVKRKQPKVYRQWREQPATICPPGGETLGEVQQRLQTTLAKLIKKHSDGVVAIVASDPLAEIIHSLLTNCEIGEIWKNGKYCGSWETISVDFADVTTVKH